MRPAKIGAAPRTFAVPIEPVSYSLYDTDFETFSARLGASFERSGFAVVSDHGLDPALIEGALARTKAFFAQPEAVKRRYHMAGGAGQRGYTPFGVETAKGAQLHDLKEFWHMGRELAPGHPYRAYMPDNLWPEEVEGFRAHISGLYGALDEMGRRILQGIARHLELETGFFDEPVRLGNSVLRLLHYPPMTADSPHVRAGAHEDINVITLLLGAEEAGLEILEPDGTWLGVNPPPGAVVCNIGDMLQRLSNHRLPSTTHRVVNPAAERRGVARYSTPFFLHFAPDYLIETLPGCVSPEAPNRYPKPITAHGFLRQRLKEIRLA
jgi:isopenicillin N synthase-like dioxygenase